MRKVNLNGTFIVAKCAYCGSSNVGMSRSPVWNGAQWRLPNKGSRLPYTRTLFQYESGAAIESQYSRAYCLNCAGDTKIMFNMLKEAYDLPQDSHLYVASVTERIPVDDGDEYDCVYFDREFDSIEALERDLFLQLSDENCDVKIKKVLKIEP